MNDNHFKIFFAVGTAILWFVTSAHGADMANVRQVSGEIGWVDVQLGRLEINKETQTGTKTTAYRISDNDTRVTDPKDEKFLNVGDLRAGQYVTIDVTDNQEDKIVEKIIVNPMPESDYQSAFGEIKAINIDAGTLTVEERVKIGQMEQARDSYFVFDPESIIAMHSPSKQPVELVLKPGDVVKVEYIENDGKQMIHYITLYSPTVTSTTTTTTVTTTR